MYLLFKSNDLHECLLKNGPTFWKCWNSKAVTTDDFRGIAISPVISKVFEHCVLDKFGHFLSTADNPFGFKKGLGCNHAIYTVCSVVQHFNNDADGSTVNLCALDLTKAFNTRRMATANKTCVNGKN